MESELVFGGSLELVSFFVRCVALAEGVLDGPTAGQEKFKVYSI